MTFESRLKAYKKEPWYSFYKVLLQPPSTFDFLLTLLYPLVNGRLIEVAGAQTDLLITPERGKSNFSVGIRTGFFSIPMADEEIREELKAKYSPIIAEKLHNYINDNITRFVDIFNKAWRKNADNKEMETLKYFIGDTLWDEFSWFFKNREKLSANQIAEQTKKYTLLVFQRSADSAVQFLGKKGVVFRDRNAPPTTLRILWIPQGNNVTSTGIYDVPESKVQLLSLLKSVLPGLIDFSTSENEILRIAKLALKLDDEYDLDTLVSLISKLYLEPNDTELVDELKKYGLPKKLIVYGLLTYVLTMKNKYSSFVVFEGITPVVIMYPKLELTVNGVGGDSGGR